MQIFFKILSVFTVTLLVVIAFSQHKSYSATVPDAIAAAQQLVRDEQSIPTTDKTVPTRYARLKATVLTLAQSGQPALAEKALPGKTLHEIENLIMTKKYSAAASLVRQLTLKLEHYVTQPGNRMGTNLTDLIQRLKSEEKVLPTTEKTVESRYRQLSEIASIQLKSDREKQLNGVLSNERRTRIEELLRQGKTAQAATMVHDAIMALAAPEVFSEGGVPPHVIDEGGPVSHSIQGNAGAISSAVRVDSNPAGPPSGLQPHMAQPSPLLPCNERVNSHVAPLQRLELHPLVVGQQIEPVIKLGMPAIDSKRRKLYVTGTRSTKLAIIDLDRDVVERTVDIGVTGGFLLFDQTNEDLYLFHIGVQFFKIDIAGGKAIPIAQLPPTVKMPPQGERICYGGRYFFDTGFPYRKGYLQKEKASYGIIHVYDEKNNKEVAQIKHGPDALYFAIDEKTGKLYASNTGDCSVTVYDLNDDYRLLKYIDVGTTIEDLTISPLDGTLFIRNRLGGSEIYNLDLATSTLHTISNGDRVGAKGIGLWPTSLLSYQSSLYVLSHFEGKIDVINMATKQWDYSIPLNLPTNPRTEGLSRMVVDKRQGRLFAALPELGLVAVVDVASRRQLKSITIPNMADAHCKGPNCILLAVSQARQMLYVYLPSRKTLLAYSSVDFSLKQEKTLESKDEWMVTMHLNDASSTLAIGNTLLSLDGLSTFLQLDKDDNVIAFDTEKKRIYSRKGCKDFQGRYRDRLTEYTFDGVWNRSWLFAPIPGIPSSFVFDFTKNTFYIGYFETATVETYSL